MKNKLLSILLLLLILVPITSYTKASNDNCQILFAVTPNTCHDAYGQCVELAILNTQQRTVYSIAGTQKMQSFLIPPDYSKVVVGFSDATSSQVKIFDISKMPISLIATLPNLSPVGWSHDSTRLLVYNPDSDRFLHFIYDFSTHSSKPLAENLRVYKAKWSRDDQSIAFAANDLPSGNMTNSVLYVKDLKGGASKVVSDPKADVQEFVWLPSNDLAFTSCADGSCHLQIVAPDGKQKLVLPGDYSLLVSSSRNDSILMGAYSGVSSSPAKLFTLNIKTQQSTLVDEISNDDLANVNLSPNGATIAYSNSIKDPHRLFLADVQASTTHPVKIQLDDFSYTGDWNPDNVRLLLSGGQNQKNTFYIYTTNSDSVETLTVDSINGATFSPRWICSNSTR